VNWDEIRGNRKEYAGPLEQKWDQLMREYPAAGAGEDAPDIDEIQEGNDGAKGQDLTEPDASENTLK
jgi:hypothetical protein